MSGDELFRKYQEAGAEFLDATRARAEELFREIVRIGDATQKQAHDLTEDGLKVTDTVVAGVRRELSRQLEQLGFLTNVETERVDHLLDAIERTTRGLLGAVVPFSEDDDLAAQASKASGAKKSTTKKAGGKKAPGKKAAAKKAPAKKAAAKKSPAKKASAKKAPAKKAAPPSGPTSAPGGNAPPPAPGS